MSTEVYMDKIPLCDFCKSDQEENKALYDAATVYGPWAYMCQMHFNRYGVGLGTGRGQRLILKEEKQ